MKKFMKGIVIAIAVIAIIAVFGFFYVKSRKVPEVKIGTIDLKKVSNGSYKGEYKEGPVSAIVNVDVKDNKIKSVKVVKHECGLGKKAEKITSEIEKQQSLNVDSVSGATLSSKVILKAVEVALESGEK